MVWSEAMGCVTISEGQVEGWGVTHNKQILRGSPGGGVQAAIEYGTGMGPILCKVEYREDNFRWELESLLEHDLGNDDIEHGWFIGLRLILG